MAKLLPNSSMSYYEDEAILIATKMPVRFEVYRGLTRGVAPTLQEPLAPQARHILSPGRKPWESDNKRFKSAEGATLPCKIAEVAEILCSCFAPAPYG
jgi:hypothetical protein